MAEKIYFTEEELLVDRWRGAVKPGTLRNWRSRQSGAATPPPYIKIGRAILYGPKDKLEAWEREHFKGGGE
jgi:hypothetical protein